MCFLYILITVDRVRFLVFVSYVQSINGLMGWTFDRIILYDVIVMHRLDDIKGWLLDTCICYSI